MPSSGPHPHMTETSPPPVVAWQTVISWLLERHYSLRLSDTPFAEAHCVRAQMSAGITLTETINTMVKHYGLLRTDRNDLTQEAQSAFITVGEVRRACYATGINIQTAAPKKDRPD